MSSGTKQMRPVKVGFFANSFAGWTGGINYLRNLLIAIQSADEIKIEPFLFINCKVSEEFLALMCPNVTTVQFGRLFHRGVPVVVRGKAHRWFKNHLLYKKINMLGIDVVSHSNMCGQGHPFITINWIPDFQHVHLPEMFCEVEIDSRNRKYINLIKDSDAVIYSSQDALDDANKFLPDYSEKFHKLSFVAIPEEINATKNQISQVEEKYNFSGKYFYLPNQFWKHKNHKIVFKAIKQLKDRNTNILLLCTGDISDYRNTDYLNELKEFICQHELEENIHLLGLIPYEDVFILFRSALAIINPSLFEGWSSTVEEAKSLGKRMILSDLPVHKEQAPSGAIYFPRNDNTKLAEILADCWTDGRSESLTSLESEARRMLAGRIDAYGKSYQDIVIKVMGGI